MNNPYKSYSHNQIDSATPAEQIGALFDKAARHIADASQAIARGDIQARYDASEKAMVIMEGLLSSLNRETPERAQAAESLELYYRTMIMMISRLNIYNDETVCSSLESSFKDMADFWRQAGLTLNQPQNDTDEVPTGAIFSA